MKRFSRAIFTGLLISLPHVAVAADPLDFFSSDADVVIRLKSPETTIPKMATLADAVQPGLGTMVRQNSAVLERTISLPALDAVDQSRDWYVVLFFDPAEADPTVVFAIPATDADELVAVLPDHMTSHTEGDWVLYTESQSGLPDTGTATDRLTAIMNGELSDVFDRADLSAFINVAHLTESYRDRIDESHAQATAALQQLSDQAATLNGVDASAIMTLYGTILDACFVALDDAESCSIAVLVDGSGISIEEYATFSERSATSVAISGHPTSSMKSLNRLPPDAAGYMGFSADMKRMMELGLSMTEAMLPDDAEYIERFRKVWESWKDIELGEMVGSFSLGSPTEGLFRYAAVAYANDIPQIRDVMREMAGSFPIIEQYGVKQTMELQPDFEKIGDRSIDLMTITQEFDPSLNPAGMQEKMQQMMFGPDGLVYRIAYLDDSHVMTVGGGREAMEELLKSIDGTPHSVVEPHRAGLITDVNLLLLGDMVKFAVQGLKAISEIPAFPLPLDSDRIDAFESEPSYVGFSLATEPNALRTKTVIPVEQMQGINSLIGLFR